MSRVELVVSYTKGMEPPKNHHLAGTSKTETKKTQVGTRVSNLAFFPTSKKTIYIIHPRKLKMLGFACLMLGKCKKYSPKWWLFMVIDHDRK